MIQLPTQENMAADQLLPLFVMDVMGGYAGLPGLFVGGLVCGSLRSV
jgi:branched-subunit amino acid ABC-type transport system permease component